MLEKWAVVPAYPLYEVSDQGAVRTISDHAPLHQSEHRRWGYMRVTVRNSSGGRPMEVHRLVALAFLGEPAGRVVRHLDGNARNNALTNLAYGTSSENNQDTVRHGHNRLAARTECASGHPYTDENTRLRHGVRYCRTCANAYSKAYQARKRQVS